MYDRAMKLFPLLAIGLFAAAMLAIVIGKYRRLRQQLTETQLDAARIRRHMERLEMVLQQAEPDIFAQVKARSDTEWLQATARLGDGQLPSFFPLEPAFLAMRPFDRTD
jgi:hypothetical protein